MPNPENLKPFKPGEDERRQNGRPLGAKNRSTIAREILALTRKLPVGIAMKHPDMPKSMTVEEIMTLVQIDKAIESEDTQAYKAVLDSAYGAPKQDIVSDGEALKAPVIQIVKPQ